MRAAGRSLLAGLVLAWGFAAGMAGAARAGALVVVSADQEAEAINPGRARHRSPAEIKADDDFRTMMDRVFGPGRWRQTSGYRTPAQENALRRAGAGTVPAGRLSRHSVGSRQKPGAYDAVVSDLAPAAAAAKLRKAGAAFARVIAEGAHGSEGPHLHIELISSQEGPKANLQPDGRQAPL